jgi:hypothetical protein
MLSTAFRLVCLAVVLATGSLTAAVACPICFSGKVISPGQRIDAADMVVLAEPANTPKSFRAVHSLKGGFTVWELIADVEAAPISSADSGNLELLVRNGSSQQWSSLGKTEAREAEWLREFAQSTPVGGAVGWAWPGAPTRPSAAAESAWAARLEIVAPRLESDDKLIARIAFGELSRAPYAVTRTLKGSVDPSRVAAWLADASLAERRAAYMLLLGIVGGEAQARTVQAQLGDLAQARDATNLAATVAADLELGGPSRLPWIEASYLGSEPRNVDEIEGVLLALSVQGTANAAIPRADIVAVYRRFISAHPAMAGFVAPDLSEWKEFSAAGEMQQAVSVGAIKDPGSRFAVLSYLKQMHATADTAGDSN